MIIDNVQSTHRTKEQAEAEVKFLRSRGIPNVTCWQTHRGNWIVQYGGRIEPDFCPVCGRDHVAGTLCKNWAR